MKTSTKSIKACIAFLSLHKNDLVDDADAELTALLSRIEELEKYKNRSEWLERVLAKCHEAVGEDAGSDDETLPEGIRMRCDSLRKEVARNTDLERQLSAFINELTDDGNVVSAMVELKRLKVQCRECVEPPEIVNDQPLSEQLHESIADFKSSAYWSGLSIIEKNAAINAFISGWATRRPSEKKEE